ncbi:aldehyde dehydrogenase [Acidaminobacter hydrogenoformans]|uniref:aldehyde dehydrogenase n=1 Tax=Acidaminobacter hydrogenoformans TaxID=65403 RepID=UPI001FA783A9|nr:aldehyde dehydrogenase [Acidaminobacter hydrogenoformans]
MTDLEMTGKEVGLLLEAQRQYFGTLETRPSDFRVRQLKRLRASIEKHEAELMAALAEDLGKSPVEAYATEIGFIYKSLSDYIKHLKRWAKPQKVRTPLYLQPSRGFIVREPYGSVLVIGPFNYPFQLVIEPLIGALAAGNCAVVKPSELTPAVSSVIKKVIEGAFDRKYVACVEGGQETNTALLQSTFDYIFFTGSAKVGKIVMEAAAKHLTPVTLELGGKSPVIVDKTAHIKEAAQRIMWGKTINAGQTCVAPDYIYVHEDVKAALVLAMKDSLQAMWGHEHYKRNGYGKIVNHRHFKRLTEMMAKDQPHVIWGGGHDEAHRHIEPTLLHVPGREAAVMQEEIFGPLLPIMTYRDLGQVIDDINHHPKPLALYLFTTDKKVERLVLESISSGGVAINDTITHVAHPNLPFGGVGQSGIGRYHGKQSFLTFSHCKSVLKKGRFNVTLAYPKYNEKQLKLLRKVLK